MEAGAPATMVTTEVDPDDAGRYGVVQAGGGRVREYAYKPDDPAGNLICNEVFVFTPGRVLDVLDERGEDNAEEDLGDTLLPLLVDAGDVREHRFDGFWRDVGTIEAYWSTHMELLAEPPPIDLDDPAGRSSPARSGAARRRACCRARRSPKGCSRPASTVAGRVERSVIGRGARVEAGATVTDSVLLPGAVVRSGAPGRARDPRRAGRRRGGRAGRRARRRHHAGRARRADRGRRRGARRRARARRGLTRFGDGARGVLRRARRRLPPDLRRLGAVDRASGRRALPADRRGAPPRARRRLRHRHAGDRARAGRATTSPRPTSARRPSPAARARPRRAG